MTLPLIPVISQNSDTASLIQFDRMAFKEMTDMIYEAASDIGADRSFMITDILVKYGLWRNDKLWNMRPPAGGPTYREEFDAVQAEMTKVRGSAHGVPTMIVSGDLGCSTITHEQEDGTRTMQRLLDVLPKIGHLPICAIKEGISGAYVDITYPGLIGSAQAMSSEIAAVLHVAPTKKIVGNVYGDAAIDQLRALTGKGTPPTIALRRAVEDFKTAEESIDFLQKVTLTIPAIFHVTDKNNNYRIIERLRNKPATHLNPSQCGTNSWLTDQFKGEWWSKPHPPFPVNDRTTAEFRKSILDRNLGDADFDLRTAANPELTRLWVSFNPNKGDFKVQGMDGCDTVTQVLSGNLNDYEY